MTPEQINSIERRSNAGIREFLEADVFVLLSEVRRLQAVVLAKESHLASENDEIQKLWKRNRELLGWTERAKKQIAQSIDDCRCPFEDISDVACPECTARMKLLAELEE